MRGGDAPTPGRTLERVAVTIARAGTSLGWVGIADVIDWMQRKQQAKVLKKSALYELVFQSSVSSAREAQGWATGMVLSQIR